MFTTFTALALAGGALRFVLQWQLRKRWDISLAVPQVLAGALVVLAGLPSMLQPFPFPLPLGLTLGLLAGFDDIPSHQFLVQDVFQDCITGIALTGPLAGEYGEPDIALVLQVLAGPT